MAILYEMPGNFFFLFIHVMREKKFEWQNKKQYQKDCQLKKICGYIRVPEKKTTEWKCEKIIIIIIYGCERNREKKWRDLFVYVCVCVFVFTPKNTPTRTHRLFNHSFIHSIN